MKTPLENDAGNKGDGSLVDAQRTPGVRPNSGAAAARSITLADFTKPGFLIPQLQAEEPAAVIRELCQVLEKQGATASAQALAEDVLKREALCPTVLPVGWAIPHTRTNRTQGLTLALGRTKSPFLWGNNRQLVRLVWLFAIPDDAAGTYLSVGSALARVCMDPAASDALLSAPTPEALFEILQRVPLRMAGASPR